ncbi:MAG: CPBP family intramembrane metalloprotease [Lachnospiraceae bacterium]|nr:CPBP family intramembrane metalloprotease [Lachnospiraceae bacterium]
MKITQKRTTAKEKIIYVIKPYILYMLIKTVSLFALAIIIPSIPIPGMNGWVENNSDILSTICNAFASIIAVAFLLKDFIRDVSVSGELDIDANIIKQLLSYAKNGMFTTAVCNTRQKVIALVSTVIFGGSLGITLNIAVQIITDMMNSETALGSDKYARVEAIQYSVSMWVGIVLYVIISPVVEEMVFRGIIYNRAKHFFGVWKAVLISALLFGIFHANLPQCIYGVIMGSMMALCYEYIGCFAAPVLFHMSANATVYILSMAGPAMGESYSKLFTVKGFTVFIVISVVSYVITKKSSAR